jgi:hypothetical protein
MAHGKDEQHNPCNNHPHNNQTSGAREQPNPPERRFRTRIPWLQVLLLRNQKCSGDENVGPSSTQATSRRDDREIERLTCRTDAAGGNRTLINRFC